MGNFLRFATFRDSRGRFLVSAAALACSALPAAGDVIRLNPSVSTGATVEYFGWDLKGSTGLTNTNAKARAYYVDTPANLIRVPIFANAHNADGTVDVSQYADVLTSIRKAKAYNPNVKVFASLKLLGGDTFPAWIESTANGSIFGNSVKKPDPTLYSNLLADYVQYMQREGIKLDFFGVNNEVEYAVDTTRHVSTVRNLKASLVSRGVPADFRSMQYVGPDTFSVTAGKSFVNSVASANGLDAIDIVASHSYRNQNDDRADWASMQRSAGSKPSWFTEVHFQNDKGDGATPAGTIRDQMAVLFDANRGGASGFVFWQGVGGDSSFGAAIKRDLVGDMLGGHPISTSPSYTAHDSDDAAPMFQAYRDGDRITFWLANITGAAVDHQILLDTLGLAGDLSSIQSTFWIGDNATLSNSDVGSLNLSPLPGGTGFLIAGMPAQSIARVTFNVPEPTSIVALTAAGTVLLTRRRRRGEPS